MRYNKLAPVLCDLPLTLYHYDCENIATILLHTDKNLFDYSQTGISLPVP